MATKDDKKQGGIPSRKEIGQLWFAFRMGWGIGQAALAKIAKVSRSKVSRVEKGESTYDQIALHNIEAHTGIPTHKIMKMRVKSEPHWQPGYDALPEPQKAAANDMISATITVINDHCGKAS